MGGWDLGTIEGSKDGLRLCWGPGHRPDPDRERLMVGLMSGTSCDGISAALVAIRGRGKERKIQLIAHHELPFDAETKEAIAGVFPPHLYSAYHYSRLQVTLARLFARAATEVINKAGAKPEQVLAISMQGITLYHDPPSDRNQNQGIHIEMGDPALVAELCGVPVISDLRANDVAAGGHGAPLSAYVDYLLFSHDRLYRALQNIGGIANVTAMPPGCSLEDIICFDTGPGNMVIDGVVRRLTGGRKQFDEDGLWAAQGRVNRELLEQLLRHPYLERPLPKTTGREDFGEEFVDQVMVKSQELGLNSADIVATVTAYTAECMAYHYRRFLYPRGQVDEVILGGGGTKNKTLLAFVRKCLAPAAVKTHEDFGIPNEAREAMTWTILADETIQGLPANVPRTSGARHPALLGRITFPWRGSTSNGVPTGTRKE